MKVTDTFKEIIKAYVEDWAMESEANLEAHSDKDKSLDECINYILNQVKESGVNGFADQEVFDMAVEYYSTKGLKVKDAPKGQVVINRTVELTEDEKKEAKEKAMRELIAETKAKARKKPTSTKGEPHKIDPKSKNLTSVEKAGLKVQEDKKKEEPKQPTQNTLF